MARVVSSALVLALGLVSAWTFGPCSVATAGDLARPMAIGAPSQPDDFWAMPDSAAHNMWVLICSALVMFMTAPGLAMFYGGLVRKKNVLSVIMHCLFLLSLMSILWAFLGYTLAFGGNHWLIGNLDYLFLHSVGRYWDAESARSMTPMFDSVIPRMTHMIFQGMFFVITPVIICGAFAERMRFGAMVIFSVVWGMAVYCPLVHWIWGNGMLSYGHGVAGGGLDFAGGTVVHVSSGVTALVVAYVVGPRLGHRQEPMPPHNLTYTALGAAMLWFGWFGFNAGSALRCNAIATNAFIVTNMSAASGALAWAWTEWLQRKKASVLGTSSGAVAGLVCITPGAGFVGPIAAIMMGGIAGIACYHACTRLKSLLGFDDSLDAFGVHGVGGTIGALLTGVFATRAVWNIGDGKPVGAIDGNWQAVLGQLAMLGIVWVYVAVVSYLILKAIDMTFGLRVNSSLERQGLDVTQHGEEGYIFL